MSREIDNADEMKVHLSQGLFKQDGKKKLAYTFYKYAGTKDFSNVAAQFKQITGHDIDEFVKKNLFITRQNWQPNDATATMPDSASLSNSSTATTGASTTTTGDSMTAVGGSATTTGTSTNSSLNNTPTTSTEPESAGTFIEKDKSQEKPPVITIGGSPEAGSSAIGSSNTSAPVSATEGSNTGAPTASPSNASASDASIDCSLDD